MPRLPPMRLPSLRPARRPTKHLSGGYKQGYKLDYSGWKPIEGSYSPLAPIEYHGEETPIITAENVHDHAPSYESPAHPEPTYHSPSSYEEPEIVTASPNDYNAPQVVYGKPSLVYESPVPTYESPAPSYHEYSPAPATYESHRAPAPIEEPLFTYAPVQDLNSLASAEETYNNEKPVLSGYRQVVQHTPAPGQYQSAHHAGHLAQEVQSGSVYVHQNPAPYEEDPELSYIFNNPAPGPAHPHPTTLPEPLFYDHAPKELAQSHALQHADPTPPLHGGFVSQAGTGSGSSSASFSLHVNGQSHGFSHSTDHKTS